MKLNITRNLLILTLSCIQLIFSEDKKQFTITSPYNPSIITSAYIKGMGSLQTGFKALPKSSRIIDSLILNPLLALQHIRSVNDRFEKEFETVSANNSSQLQACAQYTELLNKYEKICPLFLIGECRSACLLNRIGNPRFRNAYESKAVGMILDKLKQSKSVQYTSFGPGAYYPDLVILTKTLAQKPDAVMSLHFIDRELTPYVKTLELLQNNREVKPNHLFNPKSVMSQLIKYARSHWQGEELPDVTIEENLMTSIIPSEAQSKQFVSFLTGTFPNSKLSAHIHSDVDGYFNYLDKNKIPYADVIVAADIDDEMSQIKRAPERYLELCVKTLLKKPEMKNIWLAKKNYHEAVLHTLSLKKSEGFEQSSMEIDGKNTNFYFMTQNI